MKKECLIYGLFMFIFCITNSFSENLNGSQEKGFLNKIELLKQQQDSINQKLYLCERNLEIKKENFEFRNNIVGWIIGSLAILAALMGIGLPIFVFTYNKRYINEFKTEINKYIADFKEDKEWVKEDLKYQRSQYTEEVKKTKEQLENMQNECSKTKEDFEKLKKELTEKVDEVNKISSEAKKIFEPLRNKSSESVTSRDIENDNINRKKNKSEYDQEIQAASELYSNNKYPESICKFQNILNTFSQEITIDRLSDIYFYIALSYENIEEEKSLEYYKKVVDIKPNYYKAWNNMGVLYANKNDWAQAIIYYKNAIENKPDFADAYYNLGISYESREEYNEAIINYKKVIELDNKYSYAWNNLGNIYTLLKMPSDEIIKCYKTAIKIDKTYIEAWNNLGVFYDRNNLQKEAIECYKKAIEINEQDTTAYENLIESYLFIKDFDTAKKHIDMVEKINKDCSVIIFLKTVYNIMKNETQTKIEDVIKTLKDKQNDIKEWSFEDMKQWLESEQSNFLNEEQKKLINELISGIEYLV